MEVCLAQNLRNYCSIPRQILHPRRRDRPVLVATRAKTTSLSVKVAARCVKLGSAAEEELEEWMQFGEKCGGEGRGLAELLECLEKEAIMGDDHGREPNDYNRRAQIFDKSSKVFQALKERSPSTSQANPDDLCEMSSG